MSCSATAEKLQSTKVMHPPISALPIHYFNYYTSTNQDPSSSPRN